MIKEKQIHSKWKFGDQLMSIQDFLGSLDVEPIRCCIGTDSQPYYSFTKFATTICAVLPDRVLFIVKKFRIINIENYTIDQRLMDEIYSSILTANYLTKLYKFETIEIHADINANPKFRSHKCMAAAKGYVEGMGFKYVGKPNSWAASSCADWHTK